MSDRELIAAYVLGELDPPARAEFERRLEREPELRDEVASTRRLSADLEALPVEAWPADPAEPAAPPTPRRAAPPASPARRWYGRPAFALGAIAAALVVGVALGALIGGGSSGSGGSGSTTASATVRLRPLGGDSRAGAVVRVSDAGTVELDAHGLPRSGDGHYYELWLMTSPAETVPIASFGVGGGGGARVRVPLPADPRKFLYYDISRQRVGGGTAHSAESVLRGPT